MDELELIRRFSGAPAVDPAARERARRLLDDAMRSRPRRGYARVGVAAAVVAALLVSALVWFTARPQSVAARALEELAAIPYGGPEPGAGEYLHQTTTESIIQAHQVLEGEEFRLQVTRDVDQWLQADRSGERRSVVRSVTFPSSEDERIASEHDAIHLPVAGEEGTEEFHPGQGPLVAADDIPTDPEELLTALTDGSIAPNGLSDGGAFAVIGDLLAQGNLPATTRAALLDAAAHLDGVRLLGSDEDPLGRPGESFAAQGSNVETRLVFDPDTGALLARETYVPTADGVMQLASWQAYLAVELVPRIPAHGA